MPFSDEINPDESILPSQDEPLNEEASSTDDSQDESVDAEVSSVDDSHDEPLDEDASSTDDSQDELVDEEASSVDDSLDEPLNEEVSSVDEALEDDEFSSSDDTLDEEDQYQTEESLSDDVDASLDDETSTESTKDEPVEDEIEPQIKDEPVEDEIEPQTKDEPVEDEIEPQIHDEFAEDASGSQTKDEPAEDNIVIQTKRPAHVRVDEDGKAYTHTSANTDPALRAIHKTPLVREDKPSIPTRKRRPYAALVIVAILVLVIGYFVDSLQHAGKAYEGVTIAGIDVSGLTQDEIVQKVSGVYEPILHAKPVRAYASQEALDEQYENIEVDDFATVEDEYQGTYVWTIDADSLDARIDYEDAATKALAIGRSSPFERLGLLFSHQDLPLAANCNNKVVDDFATQIDYTLGYSYQDCLVAMNGVDAYVIEGYDGDMVDRDWLKQTICDLLIQDADQNRDFVAETKYQPLHVDYAEAEACAELIEQSIQNGADIVCGDTSWHADAYALARWVDTEVVQEGGDYVLKPFIDPSRARNFMLIHLMPGLQEGTDKVRIDENNGNIYVSIDAQGQMPNVDKAIADLQAELFGEDGTKQADAQETCPVIEVGYIEIPDEMTFDEAVEKGVIAPISRFTTEYTYGATERNHNIHLAADLVNMSIAKGGGGKWSFNDIAGDCSEEKGFQPAQAIAGSETVDEIGGGICQVATTIFNAAYMAGFTIDERTNHSLYIPSYPDGRDSAISYPELDLVWSNDSYSDCILVMTYDDTSITATIYGIDPGYTVETTTGEWQPGQEYTTIYRYDPNVEAGVEYVETSGYNGSSITVERTVLDMDDKVISQDQFLSVYQPQNCVIVRGGSEAAYLGEGGI